MRRKRCPYCQSLNTVEACAVTKDGRWTMDCRTCDDCDTSFDIQEFKDGKWIKVPNQEPKRPFAFTTRGRKP